MEVHKFYRSNGLRVHEIPTGKKCPIAKGWPDSTKTHDQVDQALENAGRFDKYGWLLDDNHLVVDIDVHDLENADGYASLAKLEAAIGFKLEDACGAIVQSPSGGRHFYFAKRPEDDFGKVYGDHYPGIDFIHGHGKQVIAAGSNHDKHPGKTYSIDGGDLFEVPIQLIKHLQGLRAGQADRTITVDTEPGERAGDEFNQSDRGLQLLIAELSARGYVVRHKGTYWEFDRPGKTTDSDCSGHVGKRANSTGNLQLTAFTLSDPHFPSGESITIFRAYSLLCCGGDDRQTANALFERGFARPDYSDITINLPGDDGSHVESPAWKGDEAIHLAEDEDDEEDDDEHAPQSVDGVPFPEWVTSGSGLIEDVGKYFKRCTKLSTPEVEFAVGLAAVNAMVTRKVSDDSVYQTPANLYTAILASSGAGKDAPRKCIAKIITACRPGIAGPNSLTSGAGALESLKFKPACYAVIDELADDFRIWMNPRTPFNQDVIRILKSVFTDTWADRFNPRCTRRKTDAKTGKDENDLTSVQPHLSIFGVTTEDDFFDSFVEARTTDGFLGRWMIFCLDPKAGTKRRVTKKPNIPDDLVTRLREWGEWGVSSGDLASENPEGMPDQPATVKEIERSSEAIDRLEDHYDAIDDRADSEDEAGYRVKAAVWRRASEKTARLALLFAVSRSRPGDEVQITKADAEKAIAVSNFLAKRMVWLAQRHSARTDWERTWKGVVKSFPAKKWLTWRQARRKNQALRERDLREALACAVNVGQLEAMETSQTTKYRRVADLRRSKAK